MSDKSRQPDKTLWHQSGVNSKGEPFVQLLLDREIIAQMEPELARQHAQQMIECAEAAEQDAFLFDWVIKQVGAGPAQAAGMIAEFRRFRAERTGKSQGPTRPTDWVMPPDRPPE